MNKISSKLVYVDYKQILENYRKPEFWQQRWKIYDYSGIVVELAIVRIDTLNNKIGLGVDVKYAGDKKRKYEADVRIGIHPYGYDFVVPIDNKDYTQENFERAVYNEVKRGIQTLEYAIMLRSGMYQQEKRRKAALAQRLRDTAIEFLDKINITDEAFRDAYIDTFVDKHVEEGADEIYSHMCDLFLDKELAKEYLLWASFNNNEADVEKYSKMLKQKKVSKSTIKIWLQKQADEQIDWESLLPQLQGV